MLDSKSIKPMSAVRYFYDIPVYRLPEQRYNRERDKYIDDIRFPRSLPGNQMIRERDTADPVLDISIRDHHWRMYGGGWMFNEIVGYIRLHFVGSQVRGEYIGVRKQRIVRTRTKIFEFLTWKLAPEVEIPSPITNEGIFGAALEYLAACRKELPRRYIDTELFELIGKHVNWLGLMETQ